MTEYRPRPWRSLLTGAVISVGAMLALALLGAISVGAVLGACAVMRWLASLHPLLMVPGGMCLMSVALAAAERVF